MVGYFYIHFLIFNQQEYKFNGSDLTKGYITYMYIKPFEKKPKLWNGKIKKKIRSLEFLTGIYFIRSIFSQISISWTDI